jgi:hypothetical protein
MLTLESKFSDFIELCRKHGGCAKENEAIPVMEKANTGQGMVENGTCQDGFSLFVADKSMPEMWAEWVLTKVGSELNEDCRKFFIDKITNPRIAIHIHTYCHFLTDKEDKLLEAKFINDGEHLFPMIEHELSMGKIKRAKVIK